MIIPDEIFLGRDRQLEDFRRLLGRFFDPGDPLALPQVVLISGQGGIGKSTLLREFQRLAEQLHRTRYHLLDVDWQTERQESPSLFAVDPSQIDARSLFRTLNLRAGDRIEGWRVESNAYTRAREQVERAVEAAAQASTQLHGHETAKSGGAKTEGLADGTAKAAGKAVAGALEAAGLGTLGKAAEPLTSALVRFGLHVTPQIAAVVRGKLKKSHLDLLLSTDSHLAHAMGEALREAAVSLPVLVTVDTYEIVDELDSLTRVMIKTAGPRVLWVIAGRHDLYETRTDTTHGRIDGYREEDRHAYDVSRFDLRALAREDIRQYFREAAPERPELDDDQLLRVDAATAAIPLAIHLAADIWRKTGDLDAIVSEEEGTAETIVDDMVGRYEQHCVHREEDRRTLAALALADGDAGVLKAMLLPELDGDDERYRRHLDRVRHRYAAVQRRSAREPRLHDDPARFFVERLQSRAEREQGWVSQFNERAVEELLSRIAGPLAYHPRLEDLCGDDDYTEAAVKVARHLFWLDEDRAWTWVMARYVEGLAYSSSLREGLLETATRWRPHLGQRGRRRLRALEAAEAYSWRSDELEARRKLLEDDVRRGWLADPLIESDRHGEERQAIRLWAAAGSLNQADRHDEALETLRMAHQRMCELESGLGEKISGLALRIAYSLLKDYEKAIEYHGKALELNPQDHDAWRNLGTDYSWLKDYEKAIEYHGKALELNPRDHDAWRQLAYDLIVLGRYTEATETLQRVFEIETADWSAWNTRGYLHMIRGERDLAIQAFKRAIAEDGTKPNPHNFWGALLYREGDWTGAGEKFQAAREIDRNSSGSLALLAVNRLLDLPDEPTLWDNTRLLLVERDNDPSFEAQWLALNNETDRALEKLAEAIRKTPNDAVVARFRPAFHVLRDDPRFVEMTADAPASTWSDFPMCQ